MWSPYSFASRESACCEGAAALAVRPFGSFKANTGQAMAGCAALASFAARCPPATTPSPKKAS